MKTTKERFCLLLFVLLLSSLFAVSKASDDTVEYFVDVEDGYDANDGSSGHPFASLNGALTAFTAATAETEGLYNLVINVKKGTYTGNENLGLPFFTNTTIQNEDDEDNTVIFTCDENNAWAFNPSYGSFKLTYVTITNCQRGVNVEYTTTLDYQDVDIDHVIFQNISLNAIWIEFPSSVAVKNSIFESPAGDNYAAFINVIGNFSAGIDILTNAFQDGSGVQITNMNGGNINQNSFTNMYGNAAESPPALYITGGAWDIEDNTFSNVSSSQYSPVTFHASSPDPDTIPDFGNFSLVKNSFEGCNTTDYYGGAISFVGVLGYVDNCDFTNNQARLGGAVFLSASNVTIQDSSFINNYATNNGGAIDLEFTSFLFLNDNEFTGNTAGDTADTNSLSCCVAVGANSNCTSQLIINNGNEGDFVDIEACDNIKYVSTGEYFATLPSYQYQPTTSPAGSSLWWLWMLISFALIATIIVVGVAVGAFIYTKKKRSYEEYA